MKRSGFRQTIRGCGNLPHVGEHPGTEMLILFIIMGALAGAKGGLTGAIVGALFMGLFLIPVYLYGAYDRANLSDKISGDENELE